MGLFDKQHYLWLVDRKKQMIISGGENICCREVEVALEQMPGVQGVSVIGEGDAKWDETVLALTMRNTDAVFDADSVVAFSQTRIARYKCPRRVVLIDQFPITSAGKVDKLVLPQAYAAESAGEP